MTDAFVWNVKPMLIGFTDSIGIRWYSLMFLCAFIVGHKGFTHFCRSEGKREDAADSLLMHIVLGTIIGARLGHCLFYEPMLYLTHPWKIFMTWEGGLASHGGYLGVMVSLYLFSRKNPDMPFFWLTDRIAIVGILSGGFIRIGNFFNSEILGKPSDVPWAIIFKQIDSIPRHPAQLYESLGYFSIALILYCTYRLMDRKPLEGRLFGMVLVLGYGFRFFVENFKEVQERFEEDMFFNMGQLLSLPFIIIGFCLILGWHHQWKFAQFGFAQQTPEPAPGPRLRGRKQKHAAKSK